MREGGRFSWGGVEGGGEKAYNCNSITIKILKNLKTPKIQALLISLGRKYDNELLSVVQECGSDDF